MFGNAGGGKSTLARRLAELTGLSLYVLNMIQFGAGARVLEEAPWVAFAPITVLFLTVAALNFCGDKIRAHFDVKEIAL